MGGRQKASDALPPASRAPVPPGRWEGVGSLRGRCPSPPGGRTQLPLSHKHLSFSATTFHFFTHFKMICTKFPRPSCYFSVYEFNEYDRGNYEICFYIRAGIFGTSLKQLYFAAIPYLPTRDERGSPQWRQDAQVYRVPKVIGQAGNLKRHMVIHSKERHRLCPVQQVFWPS